MESAAARVDQEIVRLKREVVRDDIQGHSCAQCNHIRLKPLSNPGQHWHENRRERVSFQLDTTVAEIHTLAASGCDFWVTISNKLKLIDLEEKVKEQRDVVVFDLKKYGSWWSDEHYDDLAASLGGVLEAEFRHFRSSPVGWGFSAGANSEMDFAVTCEDFVRVIIRYRSRNHLRGSASVDIVLVLPGRPASTVLFPREKSGLQMVTHWTTFWVLSASGESPFPI